jgi:beta-alanine degradation protein BauB
MTATRTVTSALFVLCLAGSAQAQDPTHSDGDKYKLVLDNEQVRVLSYTDQPGDKTHLHRHPAFIVVALAPFKRKIALGDGRVMAREFAAGDVLFSQGESHIGENVGSTPTRVILVELKSPKP